MSRKHVFWTLLSEILIYRDFQVLSQTLLMAFLNEAVSDWLTNTSGCGYHDEDAVFYPYPLESGMVSKSCDYHVINVSL